MAGTVMSERVRELSARYGPLLDGMAERLEAEIGPLLWKPRADATIDDETGTVRVGPIFGSGVALAAIDRDRLIEALNQVLGAHAFREIGSLHEERWGQLSATVVDGREALLTLDIRGFVRVWVDVADTPR